MSDVTIHPVPITIDAPTHDERVHILEFIDQRGYCGTMGPSERPVTRSCSFSGTELLHNEFFGIFKIFGIPRKYLDLLKAAFPDDPSVAHLASFAGEDGVSHFVDGGGEEGIAQTIATMNLDGMPLLVLERAGRGLETTLPFTGEHEPLELAELGDIAKRFQKAYQEEGR